MKGVWDLGWQASGFRYWVGSGDSRTDHVGPNVILAYPGRPKGFR